MERNKPKERGKMNKKGLLGKIILIAAILVFGLLYFAFAEDYKRISEEIAKVIAFCVANGYEDDIELSRFTWQPDYCYRFVNNTIEKRQVEYNYERNKVYFIS